MYVCVCNALKEETVRTLADEGLSFEEIQQVTGCSATCGSCLEFAEALVASVQGEAHRPPTLSLVVNG
ncbi:MAG: bacterioferritin-associated ferredoxin [Wenzhouxiangella sp.]